MPDIVICEFMDSSAVDSLAGDFDVLYSPSLVDDTPALLASLAHARALIVRNRTQVCAELLEAAPGLQVVGRLGVGLDNIDLEACRNRGIRVCPATGANNTAVAEYVIAAALMLLRGAYGVSARVSSGDWPRQACMGRELGGKLMGLVGFGGMARETARRAIALDMRVSAYDPHLLPGDSAWDGFTREAELACLLRKADVVSLHVPLTDTTRNLIDAAAIECMKPDAVLINTARGGVVHEHALMDALKSGRLAGAALDVYADEPVSVETGAGFTDQPNLLLTPHIAGVTQESNVRVSALTADNVRHALDQRPSTE